MTNQQKTIAVFDFDGTLTTKDSFFRFLIFISGRFTFWRKMIPLFPVFFSFAIKRMSNHDAKEKVLRSFLKNIDVIETAKSADEFAQNVLPAILRKEAINKLNWHLSQDHQVIVISASPELYISSWCLLMNIQQYAGTKLVTKNNRFTGNIDGRNCHGKEKVNRLKSIVNFDSDLKIYAYGDTSGDRYLLELADEPFYRSF